MLIYLYFIIFLLFIKWLNKKIRKEYKMYWTNREIQSVELIDRETSYVIVAKKGYEPLFEVMTKMGLSVRIVSELIPSDSTNATDVFILFETAQKKLPKKTIGISCRGLITWYTDRNMYTRDKNSFYFEPNEYYIGRNLLAISKFPSKIRIPYTLNEDTIYCLHLPESDRLNYFNSQPNYPKQMKIVIYPAIKYTIGWKGCVFSYLNLIYNAQRSGLERVTICEDDCLLPLNFDNRYSLILEFLSKINQEWDIFLGVIAELNEDTILSKIYCYKGIKFFELNKMASTVFNIYNKSSYSKILKWYNDPIDYYINKTGMKYIISFPFEFSCLPVESTLWETNNDLSIKQFEKSNRVIKKLIKNYTGEIINIA